MKDFDEGEVAALRGLDLDKGLKNITTSLARAYAFRGRIAEAKSVILPILDEDYDFDKKATFRQLLLEQLERMRKAGVWTDGSEQFRAWLANVSEKQ